jgi:ElaB/YqjD/DUF883 family membrane-anchored ribosome-binding protein
MEHSHTGDGTGFKRDMNRLGQDVDTLKQDARSVGHSAMDAARSGVAEMQDEAKNVLEATKQQLHGAKDAGLEASDSLKHVVSRHPMASVGIAAGVGLLIGIVLFRPRS